MHNTLIKKSNTSQIYSPAQISAITKLRSILGLATSEVRSDLKLSTRTNTLITGPSGSGKSFLAKALAAESKLPIWEANVSTWIVLGARSGNPTLVSLFDWINKHPKGIIFLDELEKPFPYLQDSASTGSSDWNNNIKMEIHDLLDSRIPDGAIHIDDSLRTDFYDGTLSSRDCKDLLKFSVEAKLRDSFLIIGAGTWQHLWTAGKNTIGYNNAPATTNLIGYEKLIKSISPEILLRFRNEVLILRPMTVADFNQTLRQRLEHIPTNYRRRYAELVQQAIPRALEFGLGMRIFEETFTDLCIEILHGCAGDDEVFRSIFAGHSSERMI